MIKSNADTTTTIDYSISSDESGKETNGIYTTISTEENVPVYYYRGNVDNNIIFGNFCWKMIRTTETGGIKLIYNGVSKDGKCDNTMFNSEIGSVAWNDKDIDNAYIGYMYGINNTGNSTSKEETQRNTYPSKIKTYLEDNWFKNNMLEYENYLEDTVFCNDRSTFEYDASKIGNNNYASWETAKSLGFGTNLTFYGSMARFLYYAKKLPPSLVCPQENDKFTVNEANGNEKLNYPVGLLTADEAVLAGYNTNYENRETQNTINYLTCNDNYWLFSPELYNDYSSRIGAWVGVIYDGGNNLNNSPVSSSVGVRSVVSLKSGTKVLETGTRTIDNPYIVQ